MARFVLVHGGFSGAWIWLPLIDSLKAAGHSAELHRFATHLSAHSGRLAARYDRADSRKIVLDW